MLNFDSKKSKTNYEFYNMDLFRDLKHDAEFDMPIIEESELEVPSRLLPFNVAMANHDYDCTVHFYINDSLFARILNNPSRYLPVLKRFKSVISPDFSQFSDFPYALRMCNAYWNRALAAWWQLNGVRVIFNVTWSLPDSYKYSFCGLPKHAILAINSIGVKRHNLSQYLWIKGYREALNLLCPRLIVRYGDVMVGEDIGKSIYFSNEHLNRMRNGR